MLIEFRIFREFCIEFVDVIECFGAPEVQLFFYLACDHPRFDLGRLAVLGEILTTGPRIC